MRLKKDRHVLLASKSITALIGNFNNLMILLLLLLMLLLQTPVVTNFLFLGVLLFLPKPVSTELQFLRSQVKLFVFYCLDTRYPLTSHGVRMRIQSDSLLPQHCCRWHCQQAAATQNSDFFKTQTSYSCKFLLHCQELENVLVHLGII